MADDPSLAMQKAIRARLVGSAGVTALVPQENILDRNARPEAFPCVLLGEDQVIDRGRSLKRTVMDVYSTLHIWARGEDLGGVKEIANAVRRSLRPRLLLGSPDYHCVRSSVRDMRFLRDPAGELGHGILTVESLVQEMWVYEL